MRWLLLSTAAAMLATADAGQYLGRAMRDRDACDHEIGQTIHSCLRWSQSCCSASKVSNCDRVKEYCGKDDFEAQLQAAISCGLDASNVAEAREDFASLDLDCSQGHGEQPRREREAPRARTPAPVERAPVDVGSDPCLDVLYADKHYGDCCGSGNYKKAGHQSVCHELQKERRAEGDAKNIDFHKEPPDSKVIVIEGDLFYERVAKRHDVMLLMFYAPWCGYCKNFSPEFREAANDLHHYGVTFAKIDTTNPENANLKKQFGIKSYPTLKILFSGEVDERLSGGIQYIRGAQDVSNFMKYVKDRKEPPMPEGFELAEDGLKKTDAPAKKAAPKKKMSAGGTEEPADSKVIILDDSTFQAHVDQNPATMVEFYAPWCGHCKKLAPHYTEAAAVLAKHDNIRIGKVDATAHKDRASELGVRGYPSVKVFLNGEFYEDYKKAREADAIVKYMRDLSKKASSRGSSGSSASSDPCLAAAYAADHYGECCGNGGVNIAGHLAPCQEARGRGRSEL